MEPICNKHDLEIRVDSVQTALKNSFEASCPLKPQHIFKTRWWNKNLSRLRGISRKSFNRAQNINSDSNWETHKLHQREYKKAMRNAKRNSWRTFCGEVDGIKPLAKLKKALAKEPFYPGMLIKEDGTYTNSNNEVHDLLMKTHFPGIKSMETAVNSNTSELQQCNIDLANRIVTPHTVKWAVNTFSPFKSPGLDGIYPILLQKTCDLISQTLVNIFRSSLVLGYIPLSWRSVKVVFLPKPGRKTYYLAGSFRPISLTSFMLKTLE